MPALAGLLLSMAVMNGRGAGRSRQAWAKTNAALSAIEAQRKARASLVDLAALKAERSLAARSRRIETEAAAIRTAAANRRLRRHLVRRTFDS
jgi:hypothetical protein